MLVPLLPDKFTPSGAGKPDCSSRPIRTLVQHIAVHANEPPAVNNLSKEITIEISDGSRDGQTVLFGLDGVS
ncbi:hypothetical protein ACIOD2_07000 [Amycolatopsis sp. NPDC088138]|uniref:hypothetical protein n=1 Tax=Amycolatopsis sp. NPDC088138 TaxID=3363938 RepID=UPI003818C5CA